MARQSATKSWHKGASMAVDLQHALLTFLSCVLFGRFAEKKRAQVVRWSFEDGFCLDAIKI